MDIRHKQVIAANNSDAVVLNRTPVNCAAFANNIVITDNKLRRLTGVFLILTLFTDTGELIDFIVSTNTGRPFNHHMGVDNSACTDLNVGANFSPGTDAYIVRQLSGGMDNCSGVDQC